MRIMKFLIPGMCLLAACAPVPQSTPGTVFTRGSDVIVVGRAEHGRTARPTERMIEQAQEVCPTARYVNALPSMSEPSKFEFLFSC